MPEITLSIGDTIILKPFCSRKTHKLIQRKMMGLESEYVSKGDEDKLKMNVFASQDAEDFAIAQMIQSIKKDDGGEIEPSEEYVNELPVQDFDLLKAEVDKLTKTEAPKVSSPPLSA